MKLLISSILSALILSAPISSAWGGTPLDDSGLWGSNFTAGAADISECGSGGGPRFIDSNGFCHIDDLGTVELGVKFVAARAMVITGVRIYRVDGGPVAGYLWSADGTLLASGTFGESTGHEWQDLTFATPVAISSGTTYIASYRAPNADYAFQWNFFSTAAFTQGPITALQSAESEGNGVFCYLGQDCTFPTFSYNSTNYWVSPTWPTYSFEGFFQPVDPGALNRVKAGSTVPVKFRLGGNHGLNVLLAGHPRVSSIPCPSGLPIDLIEETTTAGSSGLTYDAVADQYTYAWKDCEGLGGHL